MSDFREYVEVLPDAESTQRLGRRLGEAIAGLPPGLIVYLEGDLGAGKTTLVRALLRALGVRGPIKSPTFTLMEPYVVELPQAAGIKQKVSLYSYHFDFYRFEDSREWLDAGFREHFDDHALCLVEWPEKAAGSAHLPPADLRIRLALKGEGRRVELVGETDKGRACLAVVASLQGP